jgi:hypothetical protein
MVDHCHLLTHSPGKLRPMKPADNSALESLARDAKATLTEVTEMFEREREALAAGATVTNYVTLLAVRRVRQQLLSASHH